MVIFVWYFKISLRTFLNKILDYLDRISVARCLLWRTCRCIWVLGGCFVLSCVKESNWNKRKTAHCFKCNNKQEHTVVRTVSSYLCLLLPLLSVFTLVVGVLQPPTVTLDGGGCRETFDSICFYRLTVCVATSLHLQYICNYCHWITLITLFVFPVLTIKDIWIWNERHPIKMICGNIILANLNLAIVDLLKGVSQNMNHSSQDRGCLAPSCGFMWPLHLYWHHKTDSPAVGHSHSLSWGFVFVLEVVVWLSPPPSPPGGLSSGLPSGPSPAPASVAAPAAVV